MAKTPAKISSEDWYHLVSNTIVPTLLDLTAKYTLLTDVAYPQHIQHLHSWVTNKADPRSTRISYTTQQHMYWTIINLSTTSRRFALDVFRIVCPDRTAPALAALPWPLFQAYARYKTRLWNNFTPYCDYLYATYTYVSEHTVHDPPKPLLVHLVDFFSPFFSSFINRRTYKNAAHERAKLIYTINKIASSHNDVTVSKHICNVTNEYIVSSFMKTDPHTIKLQKHAFMGVLRGAIVCDNPSIASGAVSYATSTTVIDVVDLPERRTIARWALNCIKKKQEVIAHKLRKHGALLMHMWFARVFYAFYGSVNTNYRMTPMDIIYTVNRTPFDASQHSMIHLAKIIVHHITNYQFFDTRYAELAAVFRTIISDDGCICKLLISMAKKPDTWVSAVDVCLNIIERERIRNTISLQTIATHCVRRKNPPVTLTRVMDFYAKHHLCCLLQRTEWCITYVLYPLVERSIHDCCEISTHVVQLIDGALSSLDITVSEHHYRQSIIDLFFIPQDAEHPNMVHTHIFTGLLKGDAILNHGITRLSLLLHFRRFPLAACDALNRLKDHYRTMHDICCAGGDTPWRQFDCTTAIYHIDCIMKDYETPMAVDDS